MPTPIDKNITQHVTFDINPSQSGQLIVAHVTLDNENYRNALERFLGLWNFDDVLMIAQGIARERSVGLDMQEMQYPHPKSSLKEGIRVGDGMEYTALITEEAFNNLMLKLFDTLIHSVEQSPTNDIVSEDEWQTFLTSVNTLRSRID